MLKFFANSLNILIYFDFIIIASLKRTKMCSQVKRAECWSHLVARNRNSSHKKI